MGRSDHETSPELRLDRHVPRQCTGSAHLRVNGGGVALGHLDRHIRKGRVLVGNQLRRDRDRRNENTVILSYAW